ncbi:helix-turn-helix transcriptional regulator [Haloplanus pelagicus]|jgi:hypothetical protein|uniref:helix-turn-helix transcriptional regulator n=1 Tax=Haloplanus pelagicus TaxID=2949995 RepID=UPI00203C657D|nr:hypothetical protein [Haloplanus sp. HW8-1]
MRIAAPLLALLIILTGTLPATAVAGIGGPSPDRTGSTVPPSPVDRPALAGPSFARIDDPIVTRFYIDPDPAGDARWNVSIHYNLSSSVDRAAFERYGRAFEAGDAETSLDGRFFRTLAGQASDATGREMSIRNLRRNATITNGTGVLSLTFTWTNFVTSTEDGFVIEDAVLMPENRTWLASIGPSQRLVVDTPSGYRVTDTRFGLDNGSVVIQGPHTFREPLTISYQRTATEPPEESTPWALVGGALLVGMGLVAAAIYARRRSDGTGTHSGDDRPNGAAAPTPPDEDPTAASPADAADGADGTATESGASLPDDGDGEEDEDEDEDADDGVDPSLLSDEERVERLLDENGGRMKQARIVRETGWSDAKVSQLLSTMADDGRVEKLRLGRENLISLPDEDPDA